MRVIVSALAICAASFLVGVAGDLSSASARQETLARPQIVQLPPAVLPPVDLTNAVRARPLPVRSMQARAVPTSFRPAAALQAVPVLEAADEVLAGGPVDSLESPAAEAFVRESAKLNPVVAGKSGDDKASKA